MEWDLFYYISGKKEPPPELINGDIMEWDLFYYISGKKEPPPEVAGESAFKLLRSFVEKREFAEKPDSKS
ncbi:unnamed protein product [Strongylus vulgaris]|uniref:Uncharacterized protein n=1 Tax=Strongylus vulgaris TaxID=40348 RepID=A0A3P7LLG2_STRVU|nr:unnamed protein product [Strongylus vulgaris]